MKTRNTIRVTVEWKIDVAAIARAIAIMVFFLA